MVKVWVRKRKTHAKYANQGFFHIFPQMLSKVYLCWDFERQLWCLANEYIDVKQIVWKIRPQIKWEIKLSLGSNSSSSSSTRKKKRMSRRQKKQEAKSIRNVKHLECSQQVSSVFLMTFQRSRFLVELGGFVFSSQLTWFFCVRYAKCAFESNCSTAFQLFPFIRLFLPRENELNGYFYLRRVKYKGQICCMRAVELFALKWK